MKTLQILIWFRWRLMLNEMWPELFSLSRVLHVLFIVLSFILFFGFGAFCSFLMNHNVNFENHNQWFYQANIIVSNLLLFVIILKIFSSGEIIKRVSSKTLRYYPIKTVVMYIFDLLLRLLDRWYLKAACFLFGFVSVFGLSNNPLSAILSLSIEICTIILAVHFIIEIIEEASKLFLSFSRLAKFLFTFAIVILLSFITIYPIFNNSLTLIQKYTPVGFFNTAIHELYIEHKPWKVIQEIWNSLIFLSMLSFVLSVVYIFRKVFVAEDSSVINLRKKNTPLTFEQILFILPQNLAPFIIKDIRYFIRSRTTQVLITLEIIALAYISYRIITNSTNISIILFLIYCTTYLWLPYLGNIFGMEKNAFSFYMLSPTSIDNLMLSKNISFLVLQIPFIMWTWLIVGFSLQPLVLPLFILGQVSAFCLTMIYGNMNSIESPFPVERNGIIFFPRSSRKFSINSILRITAFTIYPIFFVAMISEFRTSIISYIIIAAIAVLSYWLFLKSISKSYITFIAQYEEIYLTLRKT